MKNLLLYFWLISLLSFSNNLNGSDVEFINDFKDEIQNFIESNLYNKNINEYEIGTWNAETSDNSKNEKFIYISDKYHDFILLRSASNGLEKIFELDAHYGIFDIKVEDFFNFSNLTFTKKTGGTGVQVHQKHVLYMDKWGNVDSFSYDIFDRTSTGSLAFDPKYLETLDDNEAYPSVTVEKKTHLEHTSDFIFFHDTILINSNHLKEYVEDRGYNNLEQFYDYDYELGILEFKPILSTLIFKGGFGGGSESFATLHKCELNQFSIESIKECIDRSPKKLSTTKQFQVTVNKDKISTTTHEDLLEIIDESLPEFLAQKYTSALLADFTEYKDVFYYEDIDGYYGDFETFFIIRSLDSNFDQQNEFLVTYDNRLRCGVGGRCGIDLIVKDNNDKWVKYHKCNLGDHGWPIYKIQYEKYFNIVTVNKWNELLSCKYP